MKNLFLLVVLLTTILLTSAQPVFAQGGPVDVYVDENKSDGNENGSKDKPYNTEKEGRAYAQSMPNGGNLYKKNTTTGAWEKVDYVPPVTSGQTGDLISNKTLYVILAVLALILVIAGQYFLKKSRQAHT